jgi:hypothetical protein
MHNDTEIGKLYLEGPNTRDLVTFIARNLDDDLLDNIDIQEINRQDSVASEPFMVAAVLTLGTAGIYAVARLMEKWIENRRQEEARHDISTAWDKDPELGKELTRLEKTFGSIVVKQGMPDAKMLRKITATE